jgi:hypothetical protein
MILLNWLLTVWLALLPSPSPFTDTSAYAGTGANDNTVGTQAWSAPNGAQGAPNGSNSTNTSSTAGVVSQRLKLTNFGFSIPVGATVDGVTVNVTISSFVAGAGSVQWDTIKLVNASGTVGSTDKSPDTALPTPVTTVAFGGTADLWGGDATTDWNDSDAGVGLTVTFVGVTSTTVAYCDAVQIAVTYTPAGGTTFTPRRTVIGRARNLSLEDREAR